MKNEKPKRQDQDKKGIAIHHEKKREKYAAVINATDHKKAAEFLRVLDPVLNEDNIQDVVFNENEQEDSVPELSSFRSFEGKKIEFKQKNRDIYAKYKFNIKDERLSKKKKRQKKQLAITNLNRPTNFFVGVIGVGVIAIIFNNTGIISYLCNKVVYLFQTLRCRISDSYHKTQVNSVINDCRSNFTNLVGYSLINESIVHDKYSDLKHHMEYFYKHRTYTQLFIEGLTGTGKTQLAIYAAHEHLKRTLGDTCMSLDCPLIFIVDARHIENSYLTIKENFLRNKFTYKTKLNINTDTLSSKFKEELSRHSNWLVIFDNVENRYASIRNYIPSEGKGIVLIALYDISSLVPESSIKTVNLNQGMQGTSAKQIISMHCRDCCENEAALDTLLTIFGGLPRALAVAAAYINVKSQSDSNYNCSRYIEVFKRRADDLQADIASRKILGMITPSHEGEEKEISQFQATKLTIIELTSCEEDLITRYVLYYFALLHPERISKQFFNQYFDLHYLINNLPHFTRQKNVIVQRCARDTNQIQCFNDELSNLRDFRLNTIKQYALVWVSKDGNFTIYHTHFTTQIAALESFYLKKSVENSCSEEMQQMQGAVLHMFNQLASEKIKRVDRYELLLHFQNVYQISKDYKLIQWCNDSFMQNKYTGATEWDRFLINFGDLYYELGYLEKARDIFSDNLNSLSKSIQHIVRMNLIVIYIDLNKYDQAEEILLQYIHDLPTFNIDFDIKFAVNVHQPITSATVDFIKNVIKEDIRRHRLPGDSLQLAMKYINQDIVTTTQFINISESKFISELSTSKSISCDTIKIYPNSSNYQEKIYINYADLKCVPRHRKVKLMLNSTIFKFKNINVVSNSLRISDLYVTLNSVNQIEAQKIYLSLACVLAYKYHDDEKVSQIVGTLLNDVIKLSPNLILLLGIRKLPSIIPNEECLASDAKIINLVFKFLSSNLLFSDSYRIRLIEQVSFGHPGDIDELAAQYLDKLNNHMALKCYNSNFIRFALIIFYQISLCIGTRNVPKLIKVLIQTLYHLAEYDLANRNKESVLLNNPLFFFKPFRFFDITVKNISQFLEMATVDTNGSTNQFQKRYCNLAISSGRSKLASDRLYDSPLYACDYLSKNHQSIVKNKSFSNLRRFEIASSLTSIKIDTASLVSFFTHYNNSMIVHNPNNSSLNTDTSAQSTSASLQPESYTIMLAIFMALRTSLASIVSLPSLPYISTSTDTATIRESMSNAVSTHRATQTTQYYHWQLKSSPKQHPTTGAPIFTWRVVQYNENPHYQAISGNKDVAYLHLYNHSIPCRSKDGSRHNILGGKGLLADVTRQINPKELTGICEALPPTQTEILFHHVQQSAVHGAIRGGSRVLSQVLSQRGVSSVISTIAEHAFYYGTYFLTKFYQHYGKELEDFTGSEEHYNDTMQANSSSKRESSLLGTATTNALLSAAYDTGEVLIVNAISQIVGQSLSWISHQSRQHGCHRISKWVNYARSLSQFGVFAYSGYRDGPIVAATSLITGSVTQMSVEKVGDVCLAKYGY